MIWNKIVENHSFGTISIYLKMKKNNVFDLYSFLPWTWWLGIYWLSKTICKSNFILKLNKLHAIFVNFVPHIDLFGQFCFVLLCLCLYILVSDFVFFMGFMYVFLYFCCFCIFVFWEKKKKIEVGMLRR